MRGKRPQKSVPRFRRRVLIYAEGTTEALYFKGLGSEEEVRQSFSITPKEGTGGDAQITVNAAVKERNRQKQRGELYDEVWCVLDVEDSSRRESLRQAVALAKKEGISLAVSNPSFEVWLIAHFDRVHREFVNGVAAATYLNDKHWKPTFGQEYGKADVPLYSRLADRVDAACANAKQVLEKRFQNGLCEDCNSSTNVYRLVEYLRPLAQETT